MGKEELWGRRRGGGGAGEPQGEREREGQEREKPDIENTNTGTLPPYIFPVSHSLYSLTNPTDIFIKNYFIICIR